MLTDPIDERKKFRGSVFFKRLGGFTLSFHDPLNKGFRVTVGHKDGLDMLLHGGCARRFGSDDGGPVIKASYHPTLDVLRMILISFAFGVQILLQVSRLIVFT